MHVVWIGAAAILILAFFLRVWGLADHNIWWDEGLAAWAARLPVDRIIDWTAHDVHPPLYFLLLNLWWRVTGDGEFALRFPSALAGIIAIAAIYRLGASLAGRAAGLLSALFLAVSAFAVSWSQEMRMYSLAGTLAIAALAAAFAFWRRGGWGPWIAYALLCAAGLWTLYLLITVPLIANLAFLWLWFRRGRPRQLFVRWAAAQILAALLFLPWLVHALPRMPSWSTSEPFSPMTFVQLYASMLAVGIPVRIDDYALSTLATLGALALGLVPLWRAAGAPERRAALVALALGLALPAAIVYLVSLPIHLFYAPRLVPRYLLPLAACFYLLLGMGLAAVARRRPWLAAVAAVLALAGSARGLADFLPGRMRTDDLISLGATLKAHVRTGDGVLLHTDKDWPLFAAQYAGSWTGIPYGAPLEASGGENFARALWERSDGVWLVTTPAAQRVDPRNAIPAWLASSAVAARRWDFGDNALAFYAKTSARAAQMDALGSGSEIPALARGRMPGLLGAALPLSRYGPGSVARLALYWESPPPPSVVTLDGPSRRQFSVPPPAGLGAGPVRQLVDVPLAPDLLAGDYQLVLETGGGAAPVAAFNLAAAGRAAAVTLADIPSPMSIRLGPSIELLGYSLPRAAFRPGESIELTLYWRANEVVGARYKVFTHLFGSQWNPGRGYYLWGQVDNEPGGGAQPTTSWTPGVIVADRYFVRLDDGAPPGRYRLMIGMYGLLDGARLPVSSGGDSLRLVEIEVR